MTAEFPGRFSWTFEVEASSVPSIVAWLVRSEEGYPNGSSFIIDANAPEGRRKIHLTESSRKRFEEWDGPPDPSDPEMPMTVLMPPHVVAWFKEWVGNHGLKLGALPRNVTMTLEGEPVYILTPKAWDEVAEKQHDDTAT